MTQEHYSSIDGSQEPTNLDSGENRIPDRAIFECNQDKSSLLELKHRHTWDTHYIEADIAELFRIV